jgi:23S rRNA pseudouridine2605 synthase
MAIILLGVKLKPGHVTLERALSKLGIASRTEARRLIRDGKVKLAGRVERDPLKAIVPERTPIAVEGRAVRATKPRTILLHKTRGVVTTRSDEKGRPTVYSLLGETESRLVPVGRLDLATTGLLLLTSDTKLAAWLTDPANAVARIYVVTVRGELSDETARALEGGIEEGGERLAASRITIRKRSRRESHLVVELNEGKNREIRRMLKACGHEVTKLKRVAFGGLELGELAPGRWREVAEEELKRAFPGYRALRPAR